MSNIKTLPTLASLDKCTGCGACANVCTRNAISLPWNEDGFRTPVVNSDTCIHCGMCSRTCPVLSDKECRNHESLPEPIIYGGWNKNETVRLASSSGGIFSALAESIIKKGGVVFGVEQRSDLTAGFTSVTTVEELSRLRGSKYTQAEVGTIYRDVKASLKAGKWVLFSGTPCQIDGLQAYLRTPYPQLITCDIACHGVPSRHLYDSYLRLNQTKAGSPISRVSFRAKEPDWKNYSVKVEYSAAQATGTIHRQDYYMRGFLSDGCLSQPCYTCNRNIPHLSDLTLADYWGVHRTHPEWENKAGISIIYANTVVGQQLLDECAEDLQLNRETELNHTIAQSCNGGLSQHKMHKPQRRERMLKDLQNESLPVVLKKHLSDKETRPRKDVAIMGMWMTCNYGAVFTTHALYRVIESLGLDPILLDVSAHRSARNRDKNTVFRRFIAAEELQTTPIISESQLPEWNDRADTFLVGSDQVWRHEYMRDSILAYFLNFVQGGKRRIAYGSSFGIETAEYPKEIMTEATACLHCFDAISSREHSGVDTLRNQFHIESTYVLDPVFLHSAKEWSKSASRAVRKPKGEFILSYILDPTPDKRAMLLHVKERKGLPLINMVDAQMDFEGKKAALNLPDVIEELTLEEWLYNVEHCSHFITDSFHGVCFALIFNKPFTCIANAKRGFPRFPSLLGLTEQMQRMVPEHAVPTELDSMPDTDWTQVNNILDRERVRSRQWLHNALFGERNPQRVLAGTILHHLYTRTEQITRLMQSDDRNIVDSAIEKLNLHRIEVQLLGGGTDSFTISGTEGMKLSSPEWLCRNGYGIMLIGKTGEYSLQISTRESGKLVISFRGINIRGKAGRVPCRVDVVALRIDEADHESHEVWHGEPYTTQIDTVAGQTVTIKIITRPHLHTDSELLQQLETLYPNESWGADYHLNILHALQNRFAALRNVSLPALHQTTSKQQAELQNLRTVHETLHLELDRLRSYTTDENKALFSTIDKLHKTIDDQTLTITKQLGEIDDQRVQINQLKETLSQLNVMLQESERTREMARQTQEESIHNQQLAILLPRIKWQYQVLRLKKTFSLGKRRQRYKQQIKIIKILIRKSEKALQLISCNTIA